MIMRRCLPMVLAALFAVQPAAAAPARKPARAPTPAAKPAPPSPTVAAILGRTWTGDGAFLVELVSEPGPVEGADGYAQARADVRACHAERYAVAQDNVLRGDLCPLRSC